MDHSYSESHPEGEWEEKGDIAWSELDWQRYLQTVDREIARFLSYYQKLKHEPNHLDEVARMMDWDTSWVGKDTTCEYAQDASLQELLQSIDNILGADDSQHQASDPFTLHRLPTYVITKGIYLHIQKFWDFFLQSTGPTVKPKLAWDFCSSLNRGEQQAILGLHAFEMADYPLSVCHFKRALTMLNQSLKIMQKLPEIPGSDLMKLFQKEINVALFDLREAWLRFMSHSREENKRFYMDFEDDA